MMKKILLAAILLTPGVMKADTGDIPLSSNFQLNSGRPLDSKLVTASSTTRTAIAGILRYDGMTVYQRSDQTTWQLQGDTNTWVNVTSTVAVNLIPLPNTWTGPNIWVAAASTFTFGVAAGSFTTVNNSPYGGGYDESEGLPPPGIVGAQVVYADSTTHTEHVIPNNQGDYVRVISSVTPTGGLAQWGAYGKLIDHGPDIGVVVPSTFPWTINYFITLTSGVVVIGGSTTIQGAMTHTGFSTFTVTNAYYDYSASSMAVGFLKLSNGYGTAGQVATSGGITSSATWTTVSVGGGGGSGSPLEAIFGVSRTSPTLTIKALAPFTGSVTGSTNTLGVDYSSFTMLGPNPPAASIAAGSLGPSVQASSISLNSALDMHVNQINNVVDPSVAQDAATKNYVDTNVNSLYWKQAARLATTTALPANTYSNGASGVGATLAEIGLGALFIDGVTPSLSDRVLVKNEAKTANNGIYSVTTVGSVGAAYLLTRTADYNQTGEVQAGDSLFITSGTTLSDSGWIQVTTGTVTIGSSPIVFNQFTGLGEVTAGYGLTSSGNIISLQTNSTSYVQNTSSLQSGSTAYPDFLEVGSSATFEGTIAPTVKALTASLPVQTSASKQLISAAINLNGSQVTGSLPAASIAAGILNSSVIASSITLASMYGAPTLVGTNFTSLPGAQVGSGVPAANIAAGSLGASVIASSIASVGVTAGAYTNANITVNAQGQVTVAASGSAGGGGGGSIAMGTGTTSGYTGTITSTGTSLSLFDNTIFTGQFTGGTTFFVSLLSPITKPLTVASSITFNGGFNVSSGVFFNGSVITATSTITSTMSVVMASCTTRGASPNAWITLNMSPAQQTGEWHHIYNVGADSCSIRIAGSGTNLIESTGVVRLDAQSQHAYLESLGNGLWGGDVQATPWSVFTTQDDVGTFSVSGASVVYSCPIFILTPLGFEGVRVNRTANTGQFSAAIFNMNNQYVVGVSTQQTINAVNNYMSGGVYQVSPGWYKLLFTMNNTTVQISGSNTVNSNKMFCSTVGTAANMDLSKFTPSAGSVDSNSYPAVDLIFNGGDQGF